METNKRRKKDQSADDENILLAYATLRRPFKKSINKKLKTNLNNLWRKSFNEINFIDSYCKLKSSPSQSDVGSASFTTLESLSFDANDDPDKVADCLNDLDAYLDAIDNESSKHNSTSNITDCNDDDDYKIKLIADDDHLQPQQQQQHHVKFVKNNFSTFPKKKAKPIPTTVDSSSRQYCDDIQSPSTSSTLSASFQRHQPHRNTILTSTKFNRNKESSRDTMTLPQRRLSWLRNSMRKTRPIVMPEQDCNLARINTTSSRVSVDSENDDGANFVGEPIPPDIIACSINSSSSSSNNLNSVADDVNSDDRIPVVENDFLRNNNSNNNNNNNNSNSNNNMILDDSFPLEIFENCELQNDRPRQMGRRSEMIPRLVSITAENNNNGSQSITLNHQRPNSAPEHITASQTSSPQQRRYVESEISSVGTSRNPSPVSIVSSTGSSSMASAVDSSERPRERLSSSSSDQDETVGEPDDRDHFRKWPHQWGRALATICCTLGLFNVSRFAVFSIHYGANFVVQFLILSILIGIPMLWLQMCLGAKIKKGPISMWCISPICKGISISLFIAQGLISLYTTISLGWIIIYFRDSLLSKSANYRWEEIYEFYRGYGNETVTLSNRVSDYFNGVVLQRIQLGPGGRAGQTGIGPVRFQLAFNLSLLWMFVFVILCKGLRSYGKCLLFLSVAPLLLLTIVTIKFLTIVELSTFQNLFPATDWQEFFSNSQSWATAAQETFLTWNLLGISVLSLCSKTNKTLTKNKHLLKRDGFIIIIVTIFGLLVAAVLGNVCVKILFSRGYIYSSSSSYESLNSDIFLYARHSSSLAPPILHPIPIKYLPRYASVLGETFHQIGVNYNSESGYQVLRLVTEILPPTFSVAINDMSSVWCMLTFLALLLLGIGQLAAMWKPVASLLGNSPSSVLLSCVTGLLLGIPLATESGINIIHFLDIVLGGAWWLMVLWVGQIFAIFLIRGRPYSADLLVNNLNFSATISAFIAFSWNLLIPIIYVILGIIKYQTLAAWEFFNKRAISYWPLWVRQIGGFIQISFLVLVPITAVIQIYRYLSKGPPDVLDRIQLLYRPNLYPSNEQHRAVRRVVQPQVATVASTAETTRAADRAAQRQNDIDAPPKYTPPPSYTTATGARIAKMLRQSIRRSVRRIMGEPSRNRLTIPTMQRNGNDHHSSLPPDYTAVFSINPNGESNTNTIASDRSAEDGSLSSAQTTVHQTSTLNRVNERPTRVLTASDVAQLLRPSRPKSNRTFSLGRNCNNHHRDSVNLQNGLSVSLENVFINSGNVKDDKEKTNDRIV